MAICLCQLYSEGLNTKHWNSVPILNPIWCSDLGWFGFRMIGSVANSCKPDHSKTESVHRNTRWWLLGRIWNDWAVQFWNAIKESEQLLTIQNPNMLGIGAPTVFLEWFFWQAIFKLNNFNLTLETSSKNT